MTGSDSVQELIGELQDDESETDREYGISSMPSTSYEVFGLMQSNRNSNRRPSTYSAPLPSMERPSAKLPKPTGKTKGACYVARSKVLKRMRELLKDHFGDDEAVAGRLAATSSVAHGHYMLVVTRFACVRRRNAPKTRMKLERLE